jgi:iron complex transport system ATP-binding protein
MSLVAEELAFAYGDKPVVSGLSFELVAGTVLGLVGPNGAGKSTVIRLLTRVLRPRAGNVMIDGRDVTKISRLELARRLAVVPQGGELPPGFTAQEIVTMGRTPHLGFLAPETRHDIQKVEAAMRRTDTWRFRDRAGVELSGGERQRVLLARALAQEPEFLLLDEPTNHLDLSYQVEVLALVHREVRLGLSALVVLHDLNLAARVCDRVLVLKEGRLVAEGEPARVFSETLIQMVYGARADVFPQPETNLPVILPRLR